MNKSEPIDGPLKFAKSISLKVKPIIKGTSELVNADKVELEIGYVNHGYINPLNPPEKSASCNLDVVCSAIDGFPQVDVWRTLETVYILIFSSYVNTGCIWIINLSCIFQPVYCPKKNSSFFHL